MTPTPPPPQQSSPPRTPPTPSGDPRRGPKARWSMYMCKGEWDFFPFWVDKANGGDAFHVLMENGRKNCYFYVISDTATAVSRLKAFDALLGGYLRGAIEVERMPRDVLALIKRWVNYTPIGAQELTLEVRQYKDEKYPLTDEEDDDEILYIDE